MLCVCDCLEDNLVLILAFLNYSNLTYEEWTPLVLGMFYDTLNIFSMTNVFFFLRLNDKC